MYLTNFVLCCHCKLFVFMFLLYCRALSTQKSGYMRATNLYYYYYYYNYYYYCTLLRTPKKKMGAR